ncbi:MAG: hypothetical protein JO080_12325 [Mucilaginibacter sp.]|nr:hypothetical protein [Mucilaginibacter sp.]
MDSKVELAKPRDFGEIISDTFGFVKQNFKPLLKYFFIFCGFFLLASGASEIITQIQTLNRINNFNSNSFDAPTSPFSVFTTAYFLNLFFLLLEYLSITLMTLSFMALYRQKGNQVPDTEEMWGYFKFYFFRVAGSAFVVTILVILGCFFCLIPGVYLYPIMALVFPIIVIENASFNYAFNQSFKLIKDNWWLTFGVMVVVSIILSAVSAILVLPSAIFTAGNIFLHITRGTSTSVTGVIVTTILKQFSYVFQILSVVATCLCYFNLTESKEGTGLMERINQFGAGQSHTDTTQEEY